jgi:hypothetical protein
MDVPVIWSLSTALLWCKLTARSTYIIHAWRISKPTSLRCTPEEDAFSETVRTGVATRDAEGVVEVSGQEPRLCGAARNGNVQVRLPAHKACQLHHRSTRRCWHLCEIVMSTIYDFK